MMKKTDKQKLEEIERAFDGSTWVEEQLSRLWSQYSVKPSFMVMSSQTKAAFDKVLKNKNKNKKRKKKR